MMYPTSAIALFCEDIREEKDGVLTLVGLMRDDVNVTINIKDDGGDSALNDLNTKFLAKLSVYIRINFDLERQFKRGHTRMILPDGNIHDLGPINMTTTQLAREKARERGNPLAGVIMRMELRNFKLPKAGLLKVEVELDDEIYLAGALNFKPKTMKSELSTSSAAN